MFQLEMVHADLSTVWRLIFAGNLFDVSIGIIHSDHNVSLEPAHYPGEGGKADPKLTRYT